MLHNAWVNSNYVSRIAIGLCLAAVSANMARADDAQGCHLTILATLDMRTLPDGNITIPIKIENRDLYFLVDTGGVISTIDPGLAATLSLHQTKTSLPLYGVGNEKLDHTVAVPDFSIGRMAGHNFTFYVEPSNWQGMAGTVAPEVMRNYDIDFDFAAGKFNMLSPDHCQGKVVYWTKDSPAIVPMSIDVGSGHVKIPVAIDGKTVKATLDTGAAISIMSMSAAHRYLDIEENDPALEVTNPGSPQKIYSYPFKAMNFEGVTVANPYFLILPNSDMHFLESDVILGMSTLRQLHMYIAYKEHELYLTAATAR